MIIENIRQTKMGELFDVRIGDITIYGCSYKSGVGKKGSYEFVSMPQRKTTDRDGNERWLDIVKVGGNSKEELLKTARVMFVKGDSQPDFIDEDVPF